MPVTDPPPTATIPTETPGVGSHEARFPRPLLWLLVALGLVVVMGLAVAWWLRDPIGAGGGARSVARLGVEGARSIVSKTNVALGYLENQALDESIPAFAALADEVPGEPLPARNLAVARTVALGDGGLEPDEERIRAARGALEAMERQEGPSTESLWLAARVAQVARDAVAWEDVTRRLVEAAPEDSAAWYERWKSLREWASSREGSGGAIGSGGAEGSGGVAAASLDRACELDPRNLWLVIEWCRALALDLGKRPPPEVPVGLAAKIESRWGAMEPFAPSIKTFANVDIRDVVDKGVAAANAGDAAGVAARLRGLANVLVPQSEADRRAIERHPLEFVVERYRPEFYAETGLDKATEVPRIESSLVDREGQWGSDAPGPFRAVLLEDFDLDGRPDMLLLGSNRVRVFARRATGEVAFTVTAADGTKTPWHEIASAEVPEGASGLVAADLDLDFDEAKRPGTPARPGTDKPGADKPGAEIVAEKLAAGCPAADLDVIVHGEGGVVVLENRLDPATGTRSLRPFPADTFAAAGPTRSATVADLDADGYLDLVSGHDASLRLWRNLGSGAFVPWPGTAEFAVGAPVQALVPLDWDRDVDVDVMLGSGVGGGWLENLLHGQFRFVPFAVRGGDATAAPGAFTVPGPITALDVVDADADGAWDLVVAGPFGVQTVPSRRSSTGVVRAADEGGTVVSDVAAEVVHAFDQDNDGLLDLVSIAGGTIDVHLGLPSGGFEKRQEMRIDQGRFVAVDTADLDGDGDLDLVDVGSEPRALAVRENVGGNTNHWIDVALEAQQIKGAAMSPSGRVNAHGLGSLLELKAGARYQPRPVRRRTTHFGLGNLPAADVVRVAWINGVPQNVLQPAADSLICEEQILLGSCPYLYTWNGSEFVFSTDLLWAAPLGLQRAEGKLMPAREWEYLRIDTPMVPRDDRYTIQVTEELWEAAYFDQIRLVVVDHPADVEIYSNEKVGPPDIAAFGIHTVRTPIDPVAATNATGEDLRAEVLTADGRFARSYARKLRQGLVADNALILDFGAIPDAGNAKLVLTGWTYPTTVSQNVGLSHDPSLTLPKPPSLSVPDGAGGWREAIPVTGFPGGKTKSIVIDVAGVLDPAAARLRIDTTMEIHWDAAFLVSGEDPAAMEVVELDPASADLHWRGRSRIEQEDGDGPERFVYSPALEDPRWPPMRGRFTRYGDVRSLVAEGDDRLVIMGAGDEMTLSFPVPPGPPAGWVRSFLLHSIGWDKDANLATAEGQTVEPLPFRGMRSYPPADDDQPQASPVREAWLRDDQTRQQDESTWRAIRRWTGRGDTLRSGRATQAE